MSAVIVPAVFVNLLRETLACELADAAGAIAEAGHCPAWTLKRELLRPFDAYRELLDGMGWCRVEPPQAVELKLYRNRPALLKALENRLDSERYGMTEAASRAEYRQAARRVRLIEAFRREAEETPEPSIPENELGLWNGHVRKQLLAAGADLTDAEDFYYFAAERVAYGEPVASAGAPEPRHLEMLRLRLLEGLTLREVGEQVGLAPSTVGQLLGHYFGIQGVPPAAKARRTAR
jgi:hypothetical protein